MNAPLPPDAVAVAMLPVAQIAESATNPRKHFDETYLAELAESIKSHGVIQPITVRPHSVPGSPWPYELVVGACRLRAAERAGLETIPGFWRELDDKSVLEIQVIENLQRRDVSEIEEADGYRMLMDRHGYTAEQIAEKIGKSRAYVYARLKLTDLCHAGREAFYADRLDASTALLIARIRGDKLQAKAVAECTKTGWDDQPRSYRENKSYLQHHFTISLKQATFKPGDANLLPSAGSCTDCPQRSGNDPAIFADIADADVCTDVKCFDEKKQARRDQLLALAEKKKLPILQSNEFGWGSHTDQDEDDGEKIYVSLDECCDDDAESRTYREILGDAAPVNAVAEVGFGELKDLQEFATPTALAKALKKAGWQPAEETSQTKAPATEETAEQKAAREKLDADIEAERQNAAARRWVREAEEQRREDLKTKVVESLKTVASLADHIGILQALVIGFIDMMFWETEPETTLMTEVFGYQPLEDAEWHDDHHHAMAAIRALTPADLYAFAGALLGQDDTNIRSDWKAGAPSPLLDPLAEVLGLSTPTQAAQAQGVGAAEPKGKTKAAKKTKAKAGTAATTSPNEPAAPVENQLGKTVWPFPTGARI